MSRITFDTSFGLREPEELRELMSRAVLTDGLLIFNSTRVSFAKIFGNMSACYMAITETQKITPKPLIPKRIILNPSIFSL